MSSKKKKLLECSICSCYVLSKELPAHKVACESGSKKNGIAIVRPGKIVLAKTVHLDVFHEFLAPDVNGWNKANVILLNTETLKVFNVVPRQPCVLKIDGNRKICTVWPCNQLPELCVAIRNLKASGQLVLIESISSECITETNSIHLKTAKQTLPLYNTHYFRSFLKVYLSNSFLSPSVPVEVSYYGNKHTFTVVQSPKEQIKRLSICDDEAPLIVLSASPNCSFTIENQSASNQKCKYSFEMFAGAKNVVSDVEQFVITPFLKKNRATSMILSGESGCGKTLLLNIIFQKLSANSSKRVFKITTKDELEELLEYGCDGADANHVLLIDNFNDLYESFDKLSAKLCSFMDFNTGWTLMLAVRNIDKVDLPLRRRFPFELELPVPSQSDRMEILTLFMHTHPSTSEIKTTLEEVARKTHGFTGADLKALCDAAVNMCSTDIKQISKAFEGALKRIHPTGIRQFVLEIPEVDWDDIGGYDELKQELDQAVVWPYKYPEKFERFGMGPPAGILLYGPPGCCKTMIARAVAKCSHMNFLAVKGPELFSKWVGDSEKAVRELFRRAKQVAPSIVFFDEIDALGTVRSNERECSVGDRVLTQLLTELDGLEKKGDVMVLAATNRPDRLDDALLRPGRLDLLIYVPLPDRATRIEIFRIKANKMDIVCENFLDEFYDLTAGYSGADIVAVFEQMARIAMRERPKLFLRAIWDPAERFMDKDEGLIRREHLMEALKVIVPRTKKSMLQIYEQFQKGKR